MCWIRIVVSLERPGSKPWLTAQEQAGRRFFHEIGCADCHRPSLRSESRYLPLSFIGRRHSLALYSLATITTGRFLEDIPVYMDFHIGGTNSVRGWPLDSRRGQNQFLLTGEYWYNLLDAHAFRFWFIKWRMGLQLALFGDIGTAWYQGSEFSENFIGGVGGGLRLTLPVIVLLRLDVAYARNEFGLKIEIGGAEKAIAQKQRVR